MSISATQSGGGESKKESARTKKEFRESVLKSAQEYRQQHRMEVDVTESTEMESTTFHEILNPNDELAVTYLFYELQRQYRISERLHRLTPVIMVANSVPAPHQIDDAWLVEHDWILNRAILDDSFRPALEYLTKSFTGAEVNIRILEAHAKAQKQCFGFRPARRIKGVEMLVEVWQVDPPLGRQQHQSLGIQTSLPFRGTSTRSVAAWSSRNHLSRRCRVKTNFSGFRVACVLTGALVVSGASVTTASPAPRGPTCVTGSKPSSTPSYLRVLSCHLHPLRRCSRRQEGTGRSRRGCTRPVSYGHRRDAAPTRRSGRRPVLPCRAPNAGVRGVSGRRRRRRWRRCRWRAIREIGGHGRDALASSDQRGWLILAWPSSLDGVTRTAPRCRYGWAEPASSTSFGRVIRCTPGGSPGWRWPPVPAPCADGAQLWARLRSRATPAATGVALTRITGGLGRGEP